MKMNDKRKIMSVESFMVLIKMLSALKSMGVLYPASFLVLWERRPKLTINGLGNFEFDNPQDVYGAVIRFWDKDSGDVIVNVRFLLNSD